MKKNKEIYRAQQPEKSVHPERIKKKKAAVRGRRRFVIVCAWFLFITAFAWSIYKNFTVIDTHTVHEVEVVQAEVVDTTDLQAFVADFASVYHTYSPADRSTRQAALSAYMTDALAQMNSSMEMDADCSLAVEAFTVWGIADICQGNFQVTYSVVQQVIQTVTEVETEYIEETRVDEVVDEETGDVSYQDVVVEREVQLPVETEVTESVLFSYYVIVHQDAAGDMVVIQNPTITNIPGRSSYDYTPPVSSSSVNAGTAQEIEEFFVSFFALYPQADEAQLAYYVKNEALSPIYQDYTFTGIQSISCVQEDGVITVYLTVKYQDNQTSLDQLSQYVLQVEKEDNWFITGNLLV